MMSFSFSLSSDRSICSPCGFLPLLSHSGRKRGQGWHSFNLANGGWGNQGRCNSSSVCCDTAEREALVHVFCHWMCAKGDERAVGKMESECTASGSPVGVGFFVCFLTVWVYAWHQDTRVLRYHSAQLISLGLEVTLEQALNALGEKSWGSSAPWFMPKLFLMLFDCFRYGQEYIIDTPCCHIASMEAARPAVQQSHGSVCLSSSLYLLSWT